LCDRTNDANLAAEVLMRCRLLLPVTLGSILVNAPALAATLTVGTGKTYATPCAAIAAASAGDTIAVDAGTYNGDTCAWSTDNLTVTGVNGMAKIDLTGVTPSQQKGIFTIYAPNATIENFELSGAGIFPVSDPTMAMGDDNGAGIRHQGLNLTVRNCYIHDNQDGILGGPLTGGSTNADGQGSVLIENTEFDHNGAGDGYTHNMYIGHYGTFTLQGSWSHRASVGHLVKTRADVNYILYNRITDEDGTASYEIDVPNGGQTYIVGNLIEQGPMSQNPIIISYEEEGTSPTNTVLDLFVVNNSIVNDLASGSSVFVKVGADVTHPVLLQNNIFAGMGTVTSQATATQTSNYAGDPMFVNQAGYDYHLTAGSPCVDTGTTLGMGDGYALTPTEEYVQPTATEGRTIVDVIDIGAYELGGATDAGTGGGASGGDGGTSSSSSSGGTGGSGSSSSGGTGGVGGAGGSGTTGTPGTKSGCGCAVPGDGPRGPAALLALGWLAARRGRRRRRS
jgi:MYXO-CTERM domain-containing protein